MRLVDFRITRFQFARDRVIGDSQVRADDTHVAALELIAENGLSGLGFAQSLFVPLPAEAEIERIFRFEIWPSLEGARALALVHRVSRPRGGNQRAWTLPFHEAIQVALWDLAAKQAGMPLWQMLGARRSRIKAYASGLDFHLSDAAFTELFGRADALGYSAFKIKVGHPDFERDLHRLNLLRKVVRKDAHVMVDANEAWSPKETVMKLERIRQAGHTLLWVEDPILRNDFKGLRHIRQAAPWTALNTGEYLDASGKRALMEADAVDILNVHGQVTDVMRIGWLAAELGVPVSLGNTFLEVGVHCACALPETEWLEYSFQNFDALVEQPIAIHDGVAIAPDRPGHGLELSDYARRVLHRPEILDASALGEPPTVKPTASPVH
ncbi:MAG TPA: enolase C-terminal domain-like protein [Pararobbsia sp.]|nr:enolase C-terminal domain-like protein [Pararobbsia sp.]